MTGDFVFKSLKRAMRTRDEVYIRKGGREKRKVNYQEDWFFGGEIKRRTHDGVEVGWTDVVIGLLGPTTTTDPADLYEHTPGTTKMTAKAAAMLLGDKGEKRKSRGAQGAKERTPFESCESQPFSLLLNSPLRLPQPVRSRPPPSTSMMARWPSTGAESA